MRVDLGGIKNQILALMPSDAFELMRSDLRRTEVKRYQLLQEIGQPTLKDLLIKKFGMKK